METIDSPAATEPSLNAAAIRRSLVEGQHLIKSKQSKAAALILWSAFESATRLSLIELGRQTNDPIQISGTPLGLSAQAVAHGVIDPPDREVVLRLLDAVAHGKTGSIDNKILHQVSKFTERTLDEMGQS